jgi:hypothetical protein
MTDLEITLRPGKPERAKRKTTHAMLVADSERYGEIVLLVETVPRRGTLTAPGLPEASIVHPDVHRQGWIALDGRTELTVGGIRAALTQNRRGLSKEDRAIHIELGERRYSYLGVAAYTEELRRADGVPLARTRHGKRPTVTVFQEADETDAALALLMVGTDTNSLTLTRTAVTGALSLVFGDGKGETNASPAD